MSVVLKGSTKPIVHHLHCSLVQVSLALNSLPLSVYCLPWLLCPLKCVCVRVLSDAQSLSCLCSADRRRRMSACQYPAASLLLVFVAHIAVLSVCCTCQGGMWEIRGRREEEERVGPLHLMLCGPKNRKHPPVFSIPSASLFPYPASLPGSPSLFSSHPCPRPPCLSV